MVGAQKKGLDSPDERVHVGGVTAEELDGLTGARVVHTVTG
jgi:hypothetical protein